MLTGVTSITSTDLDIGGLAFTDAGAFSNAGSLTLLRAKASPSFVDSDQRWFVTAGTYVLDSNLNITGRRRPSHERHDSDLAGGTIENTSNSTNALAGLATTPELTMEAAATMSRRRQPASAIPER